jgi:hypothetical protein
MKPLGQIPYGHLMPGNEREATGMLAAYLDSHVVSATPLLYSSR